jgi:hypothetical protein
MMTIDSITRSSHMTDETTSPSSSPTAAAAITPEVLKQAYNAFKKRLKLTRLDQESRIGRNPMSAGGSSTIVGIVPPDQFRKEVWEELVKQGRLKRVGSGMYAMAK